ncbi:MAG: biopolymer transporter ExbD [Elusimicrobia bacterium]|nr:biopolymer transporter ExbD [Elusimicrobiota bacterium]
MAEETGFHPSSLRASSRGEEAFDTEIMSGINVTPLVDVCLVLVIIFMVTAPLMSDPVIKVKLPKAHTQEGEEKDKVGITLSRDGRIALDQKEYSTLDALEPDLRDKMAMSDSKTVILRADEDALHGKLSDIMYRAKEAGALHLTIATERKK